MNRLILRMKNIVNPFPTSNASVMENWGHLSFILKNPGKKKNLIKNFEWNLEEFVELYAKRFHGIFYHISCFLDGKDLFQEKKSLATCYSLYCKQFFAQMEANENKNFEWLQDPARIEWIRQEEQIEPIDYYHCMANTWAESGFPPIYIGCRNGIGEISLDYKGEVWSYNFDMNAFQEQSYNELVRFMEEGLANNPHPDFQQRNRPILEKLKAIPKHWFGHCGDPAMSAKIFAEGAAKYPPRMY